MEIEKTGFIQVIVVGKKEQKNQLEAIEATLLGEGIIDGVQEYSLDEAAVDELLGDRAYGGGEIPLKDLEMVEIEQLEEQSELRRIYFVHGENVEERLKELLQSVGTIVPPVEIFCESKESSDWNVLWRQQYGPIQITPTFYIIPSWIDPLSFSFQVSGARYLRLYPGMGFGTGQHQTTKLCLHYYVDKIERENLVVADVLDFGCGSGILGIASILLGAESVVLCDIDRTALQNTLQNILFNFEEKDLSAHSVVSRDKLPLDRAYQIVFANILQSILYQEIEVLKKVTQTDGQLIMSGLLVHQCAETSDFFTRDGFFVQIAEDHLDDWGLLVFKRTAKA